MARENPAGARWRRSAAAVGFAVILVPVAVGVPRAVFAADSQPTIGQLVTAPTSADSGSVIPPSALGGGMIARTGAPAVPPDLSAALPRVGAHGADGGTPNVAAGPYYGMSAEQWALARSIADAQQQQQLTVLPATATVTPDNRSTGMRAVVPDGPLGIPGIALAAYQAAERSLAGSDPGCGLSWTLLAGIGRIESGHAHGGAVDSAGTTLTPIRGPVLSGGPGMAAIPDTDGGRLDGDPVWDRAVGPMQFIPGTWARSGVDGNGDGVADPNNLFDAALTAGRYLCAGGGDLRDRSQAEQAVFRYNHSADYVSTVVTWADAYGNRVAPIQSALPLPAPQPSAPPPPPPPARTASPAVRIASPPTPAPTTTSAPTAPPPTTTTPATTTAPPPTKTTPPQPPTTTPPTTTPPTTTSATPLPPPTTTSAAAAPDLRAFLGTWSGNGRMLTVAADGSGTFSDVNHRTLSFRAASRTTPTELTVTVAASTDPALTKNTSVVLHLDSPTVLQVQTPGASPSERVCQPYDPKTSPSACSTPS